MWSLSPLLVFFLSLLYEKDPASHNIMVLSSVVLKQVWLLCPAYVLCSDYAMVMMLGYVGLG